MGKDHQRNSIVDMAKRPIAVVAADFSDVLAFLQERGIVPADPSAELVQTARTIHAYTYSLILWRFRLRNVPEHGNVFLEEIASDALQILPQLLMGYIKTGKVANSGNCRKCLAAPLFLRSSD